MISFIQYIKENSIQNIIFKISKKYKCDMRGSCDWVAEELTKEFLKHNINNFNVIEGWADFGDGNYDAHTWIEIEGKIIDPTKEQYNDLPDFKYKKDKEFIGYNSANDIRTIYKTKIYTPEEYIQFAKEHLPHTPKRKVLK